MVIDQIHIPDIPSIEAEDDTPVAGHSHCPRTREIAPQRMEPETRQVHISRLSCFIKTGKNTLDLGDQQRRNPLTISLLEQALKAPVAEAKDHE